MTSIIKHTRIIRQGLSFQKHHGRKEMSNMPHMPWSHVNFIWYCNFSSLVSSMYGYSCGSNYYDVATVPLGVFTTLIPNPYSKK